VHVGGCGRCQRRLLAVQRVGAAVRGTPITVPTPRLRVPQVAVTVVAGAAVALLLSRLPGTGVQVGILGSHNADHASHGGSRVDASGVSAPVRTGSQSGGVSAGGPLATPSPEPGTGGQGVGASFSTPDALRSPFVCASSYLRPHSVAVRPTILGARSTSWPAPPTRPAASPAGPSNSWRWTQLSRCVLVVWRRRLAASGLRRRPVSPGSFPQTPPPRTQTLCRQS
jgi:hypothetical protein